MGHIWLRLFARTASWARTSPMEHLDQLRAAMMIQAIEDWLAPDRAARRESLKLYNDSMRYLTTLSAGSVVLVATFLENVPLLRNTPWRVTEPARTGRGEILELGP